MISAECLNVNCVLRQQVKHRTFEGAYLRSAWEEPCFWIVQGHSRQITIQHLSFQWSISRECWELFEKAHWWMPWRHWEPNFWPNIRANLRLFRFFDYFDYGGHDRGDIEGAWTSIKSSIDIIVPTLVLNVPPCCRAVVPNLPYWSCQSRIRQGAKHFIAKSTKSSAKPPFSPQCLYYYCFSFRPTWV